MLAVSVWWHLSGVKTPQLSDAPVGRPLMRILDHLTLAWVRGGKGLTAAEYDVVKAWAMVAAAIWRWWSVTLCPPITN